MADITEAEQWDTGVYQLETTDPVQGGVDGVDNIPHKALANRTVWLKAQVALKALLGGSATQLFKAKAGVASDDVVNKGQMESATAGIITSATAEAINIDSSQLVTLKQNVKIVDFGTVVNNNRYVIANPFGDVNYQKCIARVEIQVNGEWGDPHWENDNTAGNKSGTKVNVMASGIVVQTGNTNVSYSLNSYTGAGYVTPASLTSAPCRVTVIYIGDATNA